MFFEICGNIKEIETFAVGLVASIIGVLAGLVVAPALAALLRAGGIDLGSTGIVVSPATVIIGLVIGMVATTSFIH